VKRIVLSLLILLVSSGPVRADIRCDCKPCPGSAELGEPPVCGHHNDIWGFSLDVPAGACGDPYLHGLSFRLTGRASSGSLIVAFAAYNADGYQRNSEFAASYVAAARSEANGPVTVLSRRSVMIGGAPATRLVYQYTPRHRQYTPRRGQYTPRRGGGRRLVDVVTLLRTRPGDPSQQLSCEYAFLLETTPEKYRFARNIFERVLTGITLSAPDR
jgi:hypothetical protein